MLDDYDHFMLVILWVLTKRTGKLAGLSQGRHNMSGKTMPFTNLLCWSELKLTILVGLTAL